MAACEGMDRKEVREEYERMLSERLNEAGKTLSDGTSVDDILSLFKDVVTVVAAEVVGYRGHKDGKEGNTWWTGDIKEATERREGHGKNITMKECGWENQSEGGIRTGVGMGKQRSWSKKVR